MAFKIEICYLKVRREYDWLMEVVGTEFDGLLNLLNENVIVYGGAIRDCIARKPLLGDIDLATTPDAFQSIVQAFRADPKWVELREKTKSSTKYPISNPIKDIKEFKNVDGIIAQVMSSNTSGSREEKLYFLPRNVDIACCGLALTHKGEVLELVEGAVKDCINNVLRINPVCNNISGSSLASRIEKLTGRGWKSKIDLESLMRKEEKKQKTASTIKSASKTLTGLPWVGPVVAEMQQSSIINPSTPERRHVFNFGSRTCSESRNMGGPTSLFSRFSFDTLSGSPLPSIRDLAIACRTDGVSLETYEDIERSSLVVTLYAQSSDAPTVMRLFGL
jgi:hypothetical protein